MHLADTFIQSDLYCIQVTVSKFDQLLLSLGLKPMILVLLAEKLQESSLYIYMHTNKMYVNKT